MVVIGIGFLGALLTRLASHAGARVIAISRRAFALQLAREHGGRRHHTHGQSRRNHSPGTASHRWPGLRDRVIEAIGMQWPLDLAGELTRVRGRLVIAGYHQDAPRQVNMQLWNWRGLDVINAHERDPAVYVKGIRQAVDAVANGVLDPGRLFTHSFDLDQLDQAFEMMQQRPDGFLKALVRM